MTGSLTRPSTSTLGRGSEVANQSPNYGIQGGVYSRSAEHCVNGHPFDEENTRWSRRKSRNPAWPDRWQRVCRACAKAYRDRHAEKKAEEKIMALWNEVVSERGTE